MVGLGEDLSQTAWGQMVGPMPTTTFPTSTGVANSSNIWSAITTGLTAASNILGARYAVPQLNPGQMIQTTPYGTTLYQGNPNSGGILPSLTSGGSSSLLLLGGAALLVVLLASRH